MSHHRLNQLFNRVRFWVLSQIINPVWQPRYKYSTIARIWAILAWAFSRWSQSIGCKMDWSLFDLRSDVFLIDQNSIRSLQLSLLKYDNLENNFNDSFLDLIHAKRWEKCRNAMRRMKKILGWLWVVAVASILDELRLMKTLLENEEWPRVWWVWPSFLNV